MAQRVDVNGNKCAAHVSTDGKRQLICEVVFIIIHVIGRIRHLATQKAVPTVHAPGHRMCAVAFAVVVVAVENGRPPAFDIHRAHIPSTFNRPRRFWRLLRPLLPFACLGSERRLSLNEAVCYHGLAIDKGDCSGAGQKTGQQIVNMSTIRY